MLRLLALLWNSLFGSRHTSKRGSGTSAPALRDDVRDQTQADTAQTTARPTQADRQVTADSHAEPTQPKAKRKPRKPRDQQTPPVLVKLRYRAKRRSRPPVHELAKKQNEIVSELPYRHALPYVVSQGKFLDLSHSGDDEKLNRWQLPILRTPQDLADWLNIPLGRLAWLTHRFSEAGRPVDASKAHYHYQWKQKRSGGYRLIEAPFPFLKQVQEQIHDEILLNIPTHAAAHGFCCGRSVLTNALPHVGQHVLVKLDLDNFYSRVRYSRVVATFRAFGYSREVAIWLAKLTTSAIPANLPFPGGEPKQLSLFLPRHLPQGAPTSPAIANLVAYSLDVRLSGLAKKFNASYTRYGDDLTFSGDDQFRSSLRLFLPLVRQIIRDERFLIHKSKRRILKQNTRQSVTGVVVNEKPNVSRRDFDRLKATLHNCIKFGPASQNRTQHPHFRAHLRGKIAFVQQLNRQKGEKLVQLFEQIVW